MTPHMSRHTFTTTVTLENGVPHEIAQTKKLERYLLICQQIEEFGYTS
jgi:hypothetical protein